MNGMTRWILTLAIIFLLFPGVRGSSAGQMSIDGTAFATQIEAGGEVLHIKGVALLRYLIFIKAYTGAFYLPQGVDGSRALDEIPRYLVLEYRVAISAQDFADATYQKIKESVSSEEFQRIEPQINAINRLYLDVDPGDRYALTYIPGRGTQLSLNGTPLGTVEGPEFSRALFSIWIGDNPIDGYFRDRLLGKIR
ncbi:MAG: chalcone isomerase family protein [Desulfobacterales bacterium]|nr:chalcone isomerase family protein [Desulfobacterales bacterium]